jgi:phosphoglycerate kinase
MKIIQNADVKNKKVIVRVDFNVPVQNGKAQDVFRIEAAMPTIEYLIKENAKEIILISHLGRPDGKMKKEFSLEPVAEVLSQILKSSKILKTKIEDLDAFQITNKITLLENIRFYPEEESNNKEWAKKISKLGEIFIFDAFGAAHRDSVSCTGLAQFLPSYAGLLVQKEVVELTKLIQDPEKPFVLVLGGKKTADKLPVIKNLFGKVDQFIIGGGIANIFLAAKELNIGKSAFEPDLKKEAIEVMNMILDEPLKDIFIPQDVVVSKSAEKNEKMKTVEREEIQDNEIIVDIGEKTIEMIEPILKNAKTIFWNGSFGITEVSDFGKGTKKIAEIIAGCDAYKVLAGGDTVGAVNNFGLLNKFDFVSSGGGAALEFLAGRQLPALMCLE